MTKNILLQVDFDVEEPLKTNVVCLWMKEMIYLWTKDKWFQLFMNMSFTIFYELEFFLLVE